MRSDTGVGAGAIGILAVVLATASCTGGAEQAAAAPTAAGAGETATGSPAEGSVAGAALGDGTFEVHTFDLSVRHAPATTAVQADVRATAAETIERLEFDYCGPPLLFLSIDGSTVMTTLADRTLRAELDAPLQEGMEFGLRFLAVVPREQAPPDLPLPDVAAELLCR